MKDFDLDVNFNGDESDIIYLNADGDEPITADPKTDEKLDNKGNQKKSELASQIDKYTNLFKGITSYETPADRKARLEKEKLEQGKQTTILGMNPFVAIGVSLVIIIAGVITVIKLKQK
jgi:hypothetical protein